MTKWSCESYWNSIIEFCCNFVAKSLYWILFAIWFSNSSSSFPFLIHNFFFSLFENYFLIEQFTEVWVLEICDFENLWCLKTCYGICKFMWIFSLIFFTAIVTLVLMFFKIDYSCIDWQRAQQRKKSRSLILRNFWAHCVDLIHFALFIVTHQLRG